MTANHVISEKDAKEENTFEQMDMFSYMEQQKNQEKLNNPEAAEREKKMQQAMVKIKDKYGKNAVLKGMNLEEGATAMQRNSQIGGHRA